MTLNLMASANMGTMPAAMEVPMAPTVNIYSFTAPV